MAHDEPDWDELREAADDARRYLEAQEPYRLFAVAATLSEKAKSGLDEYIAWSLQATAEELLGL